MSARIGFVHFGTYPDIRVVKMTNTLAQAGYEVIVLARNIKGATEPGVSHPYAHVVDEKLQEWRSRLQLRRLLDDTPERWRAPLTLPYYVNPVWRRAIRDLVVKEDCQLLIVRDMPLVLAATAVGKRYGVPVIFDMAENYPAALSVWRRYEGVARYIVNSVARNVALARVVEKAALRASSHVLVVTDESRSRIAEWVMDTSQITVVENTPVLEEYDADLLAPVLAVGSQGIVIVYTGELHVYRGIETCLYAAKILKDIINTKWWFIGSGKKESNFRQLAEQLALISVTWYGWQPHPQMRAYITKSDIGIVPHFRNPLTDFTMPNKVYDYMAFRKPVVVSDCRPMKRLVEETGCGLVFRSQDAEDLAEKVLMLRNPALRAEMGARGRKAVEERYNWRVDGERFLEVVHSLLP